jgi:hypothetical protein
MHNGHNVLDIQRDHDFMHFLFYFWSFAEIANRLSAPVHVDDKDYGTCWIGPRVLE